MKKYKIGNVIWCWEEAAIWLKPGEYMALFLIDDEELESGCEKVYYKSELLSLESCQKDEIIVQNSTYELATVGDDKLITYHWYGCKYAYGYYINQFETSNIIKCYFNPKMQKFDNLSDTRFFSNAGMHSKLLQLNGVVLHASYINYNGHAILFTAPSQTGKSTQAELWAKHEEAEIINGDRVLVRKIGETWHAFGYPGCGSSKICVNKTLPLRAIVVLEQGTENIITSLSLPAKVRSLVSATEVFVWNKWEVDKAFSIAEQLIEQVPVFKLSCRPDKEAVEVLKQHLEEIP